VKTVEELNIPELTSEQIEKLCLTAEETARKHILSKVPSKKVEVLNIGAEVEGIKPVKLTIDVDVALSSTMENHDLQKLVDDAVRNAFKSAEKYLRELKCQSQK
jgi:hypothetical protein